MRLFFVVLCIAVVLAVIFLPGAPPWPSRQVLNGTVVLVVFVATLLTPWKWCGRRRWLLSCILAIAVGAGAIFAYWSLSSRFVVTFKDAPLSPVVIGHTLHSNIEEMRQSDPSRFTYEELLNLFERQPERICTPGSISCIRLSLATAWALLWCAAITCIGAVTLGPRAATLGAEPSAGTGAALPASTLGLIPVAGTSNSDRLLDVVFIHGLDGNARSTWMSSRDDASFWPAWLAEDFPDLGVWTLGYVADVSTWTRESMPLADRGTSVLEQLVNSGIGNRPVIFIGHSMGGLVAKQLLRQAEGYDVERWQAIARNCCGVIFVATPHAGSALANFATVVGLLLRTNEAVAELSAHDPRLRDLHNWFRGYVGRRHLRCRTYCECSEVREVCGINLPKGLIVVNATSAEPNIPGEVAIPLQENHITIAKPKNRQADLYRSIVSYFNEVIQSIRAARSGAAGINEQT